MGGSGVARRLRGKNMPSLSRDAQRRQRSALICVREAGSSLPHRAPDHRHRSSDSASFCLTRLSFPLRCIVEYSQDVLHQVPTFDIGCFSWESVTSRYTLNGSCLTMTEGGKRDTCQRNCVQLVRKLPHKSSTIINSLTINHSRWDQP